MDQCTVASDAAKCYNCKGNHLATSNECSLYREQEKRMLNLINQFSTSSKPVTTAPAVHNTDEFPPLPNLFQQQKELLQSSLFDDILNALTSKMETIIEQATSRIFKALQKKISKLEKFIGNDTNNNNDNDNDNVNINSNKNNNTKDDDALMVSDSDSNEDGLVLKHIKNKQKQRAETTKLTTSVINTSAKPKTTTLSSSTTSKPIPKQKSKSTKRAYSPNSSLNTSTNHNKDSKTNTNDD